MGQENALVDALVHDELAVDHHSDRPRLMDSVNTIDRSATLIPTGPTPSGGPLATLAVVSIKGGYWQNF